MRRTLIGLGLFASLVAAAVWASNGPPDAEIVRGPAPDPVASGLPPEPLDTPVALPGVDLAEVRAALPNNVYWTDGLPTTDPEVLRTRETAARERNLAHGRILSGNASEAEIDAYYDERQHVSEDYVAFSRYVLGRYRAVLLERDTGLLELAQSMNEGRLAQLPDERLRAYARKQEQDRARAAWNDPRPGGEP